MKFSGVLLAETPTPRIHELLYDAHVESIVVYGYGKRWQGEKSIMTPKMFSEKIEVQAPYVTKIPLETLSNL